MSEKVSLTKPVVVPMLAPTKFCIVVQEAPPSVEISRSTLKSPDGQYWYACWKVSVAPEYPASENTGDINFDEVKEVEGDVSALDMANAL